MLNAFTPDLELFVAEEVQSGRFPNRDAVLAYAVRLMQRDREEAVQGIKEGLEDVERGRTTPVSQVFAELRNEFGIAGGE